MDNNYADYEVIDGAKAYSVSGFAILMRKVYVWMTLALAVTGLTAYYVGSNVALMQNIFSSTGMVWGLFIAEIVLVVILSAAINKMSFPVASLIFVGYSILNGVTLSVIFLAYTQTSIAQVFFITAGTFAAMSLVGYFTKRDLSGLGKILFMGLIGLVIATIVNMFLGSNGLDLVLSYIGVAIFVGLTAWDTQKIKQMFVLTGGEVNDATQKLALMGSLSLYLDFINLFLYLLRIFGSNRD